MIGKSCTIMRFPFKGSDIMPNDKQLSLDFEIDYRFVTQNLEKLKEARKKSVEAMGMVWSDETKELTRNEDHVDTGLYINSIGYVTNTPGTNKSGQGERAATEADVIYDLQEGDKTTLIIGSNVGYAESLEKRFSLMARGLDRAEPRMKTVAQTQVKKVFDLE